MSEEGKRAAEPANVESIIGRIREEIQRKAGGKGGDAASTYRLARAGEAGEAATPAEKALAEPPPAVIHSPHLRYLNEQWQIDPLFPITSHRPGVGLLIVAWKKLLRKTIIGLFLPIFSKMQDFFSNLVNFSNEVARRVDQNAVRSARNDRLILDDLEALGQVERELAKRVHDLEGNRFERLYEVQRAIVDRMDLLFEKLDREVLSLERRLEDMEARLAPPREES